MNENEIRELKSELMKPGWTEDLHHELEKLDPGVSKQIVEAMNDFEIARKVNDRRFQEDYICDYIQYLWEISEESFWKHVEITLNPEVGILWGDEMFYFEKMCTVRIPDDVFLAVLEFVRFDSNERGGDSDIVGCILKNQVQKFDRYSEIQEYVRQLNDSVDKNKLRERINTLIEQKCDYLRSK